MEQKGKEGMVKGKGRYEGKKREKMCFYAAATASKNVYFLCPSGLRYSFFHQ